MRRRTHTATPATTADDRHCRGDARYAVTEFEVGELAAKRGRLLPSRSVKRNWTPGCGRSLRTISPMFMGLVLRSDTSLISATQPPDPSVPLAS
ncbi:hypothetical protein [Streptomyces sp. NBC_01262]|uniref:hypothetical protein n=1 Tax=Streptomyces sp. NBC_01262 TaxID=2903803 RepID=UPI003FCE809A